MHRTTPRFWTYFEQLPDSAQRAARRNFRLLTENPRHPSLRFKKVGKFWSVRVGVDCRALAVDDDGDFIWVWIGTHDEYDRLVGS
ncbi:MAG: hypothetical protein OXG67_17150 [bacterium]|nr:hypothetical protein [bacterium]MCY3890198.1 hypothetical protein [bacterium]